MRMDGPPAAIMASESRMYTDHRQFLLGSPHGR
jgi:hypothetical protein